MEQNLNTLLKNKLWTIVVVMYFFFYIAERRFDIDLMQLRWLTGMSGYLFLWDIRIESNPINSKNLSIQISWKNITRLKYYIVLMVFSFISIYINGNIELFGFLYSLHFFGIALILLNIILDYRIISVSYWLHVVFCFYHILVGTDPNFLFNVSRNYVSIIMLIQIALLYISASTEKRNITVLPAYINLFLAIWAVGRAGIIVTILVILGVYITKIKNRSFNINCRYLYSLALSFLALIIIMFLLFDTRILYERVEYYLSKGLQSSARTKIVKEYATQMASDVRMFLWGVPIDGNKVFIRWDNNLHNSYLRAHYAYGFFGVIILVAGIINSMYKYLRRNDTIFLFLIMAISTRLLTDTAAFYGVFDPLVFYFIYDGFERKSANYKLR